MSKNKAICFIKAFLYLPTIIIPISLPAFAIVVSGGSKNLTKSAHYANSAPQVCSLSAEFPNGLSSNATCVLIKHDKKSQTGWVLTAAHVLIDSNKNNAQNIYINFHSDPYKESERILFKAEMYVRHPSFNPSRSFEIHSIESKSNQVGPDIAMIQFALPNRILSTLQSKAYHAMAYHGDFSFEPLKNHLFMIAGFGVTASIEKITDVTEGVRRMGYLQAQFIPSDQSHLKRDSFESRIEFTHPKLALKSLLTRQPFSFQIPKEELFFSNEFMGIPASGDSGGPLYIWDQSSMSLRVVGIYDSTVVTSKDLDSAQASWTALTPAVIEWIDHVQIADYIRTQE